MGPRGRTRPIAPQRHPARAAAAPLPWYDERALFRILLALLLLLFCAGNRAAAAPAAGEKAACPGASACGSEEETKGDCHGKGCGGGCGEKGGCDGHRACCVCTAVWESFAPTPAEKAASTSLPLAGTIQPPARERVPSFTQQPPVPPPRSS